MKRDFSSYYLTQECQKIKSLCTLHDWASHYSWFKIAGKYDVHVKKSVCNKSREMEQAIKSQANAISSMIVNTMNDVNRFVSNYEDQISNLQREVKQLRQNAYEERQGFNSKLAAIQRRNDSITNQLSSQRQEVAQLEYKIEKLKAQLKRSEENNNENKKSSLEQKDKFKIKEIQIKNEQQKFNKLTVQFRNYQKTMQDFLKSNNINPESLLESIENKNKYIKVPSEKYSNLSSRSFSQPNIPKFKDSSIDNQKRNDDQLQSQPWVLPFDKSNFMKKRT